MLASSRVLPKVDRFCGRDICTIGESFYAGYARASEAVMAMCSGDRRDVTYLLALTSLSESEIRKLMAEA